MTDNLPILGLLLDVDGPIASPVSRSIAIPSIASDLVELANSGIPIAFNTGRSDAFIREQVVPHLVAGGLGDAARVWAVCEKGAVTARITPAGMGDIDVDATLAMPKQYCDAIRELVKSSYSDVVFYDETKRAMVSVEQLVSVSAEDFAARRGNFDADAARAFERLGLGYEWDAVRRPDASGAVPYRIDPTIISTDIESVRLGKDLGAEKLLALLKADGGPIPTAWRTLGDSRTDYAMADWLHAHGFNVAHVDVRPADGVPATPYPVRHHPTLIHDDAGALYLGRWVGMLRGNESDDAIVA
ncbi:hypothetical protein [Mycetocola zhadangensis]|uniref:HAD family hydrolase n=1 Tax=Mycetocola zhadangensis TaxID=1164595 RepID=A0A3L7J2H2_9MICO|nr:hypothetical protein [Mycetocola zhadangensis]RLQ84619.1 hypothetical protein D9V28_10720 [Mycetocola zhadangensis]GGE91379.1 hypothetical protein GCM10011313_12770 [Mycetocola zhadangensis]